MNWLIVFILLLPLFLAGLKNMSSGWISPVAPTTELIAMMPITWNGSRQPSGVIGLIVFVINLIKPRNLNRSRHIWSYWNLTPSDNRESFNPFKKGSKDGTPEKIRTSDTRFRKPLLYPTQLREHIELLIWVLPLCNRGETLLSLWPLVKNWAFSSITLVIFNDKLMTSFPASHRATPMIKNTSSEFEK